MWVGRWWFLLKIHFFEREDDPCFYHSLFIHSHFISCRAVFLYELTDTCPDDFPWRISAFQILVVLVGMTEPEAWSPNSPICLVRSVPNATRTCRVLLGDVDGLGRVSRWGWLSCWTRNSLLLSSFFLCRSRIKSLVPVSNYYLISPSAEIFVSSYQEEPEPAWVWKDVSMLLPPSKSRHSGSGAH